MLDSASERGGPAAAASAGAELARGALFNFAAMMASNLRGIFTILVARMLGGAALGTFAVAWATTDLFSKIGTFGLDSATIAFVARSESSRDTSRSKRVLHTAVACGLVLSALTAGLGIFGLQTLGERIGQPPELLDATSCMLLALPGLALYRISNGVSRGMKVMQHDIYTRGLTEAFVTTAVFLFAVSIGLTRAATLLAAILGTGASGLVAYWLASGLFRGVPAVAAPEPLAGPLLGFSAPIAIYSLLNIFLMRMDMVLLQFYVDRVPGVTVETVGIYAAAAELAGGLRKVRQAFEPIFTAIAAAQATSKDMESTEQSFTALARWLLAIVLPVLCLFMLAGSTLLSLYGAGFEEGGQWLVILGAAGATNAFVGLAETVIMVHHPRLNLLNSSVTVVVAVASASLLIPAWGATGAAIGMLVPYCVQGLLRHFELKHLYGWKWPWRAFARPVLAAACAMVPAWIFRAEWPGAVGALGTSAIFIAGYLGVWRVLGLDAQDRKILAGFRRSRKRA